MRILGIEASCDETAAAIVENGVKILSSVVASSSQMHAASGGVIPEVAARQQVVSILPVVDKALVNAKCQMTNVDSVAITIGPGLIGSLLVGVETAKVLALIFKKPIIPVNHLVAHLYANWLGGGSHIPKFPALALVVSGGHTDLVLMKDHGNLKWIGGTRDDAAGEAFDKCARIIGLPYPGGPAISAKAEGYLNQKPKSLNLFPRPMIHNDNFDWSFSGLKTSVLKYFKTHEHIEKGQIAAEIQEAIVDVLVKKTLRAAGIFKPRSLLLAGGVAANLRLREKFELEIRNLKLDIVFNVPPPSLCTDNAAYISSYAFFNQKPSSLGQIFARPELTIVGQP